MAADTASLVDFAKVPKVAPMERATLCRVLPSRLADFAFADFLAALFLAGVCFAEAFFAVDFAGARFLGGLVGIESLRDHHC